MTDSSEATILAPDASAHSDDGKIVCGNCPVRFKPRTNWQKFHSDDCRRAYHRRGGTDGGMRAIVSKVSILRRGVVSVVLRFGIEERDRAEKLTPGDVLEVVR